MRVAIVCENCGNKEVAVCDTQDPTVVGLLLLACHASPPHSNPHKLTASLSGTDFKPADTNKDIYFKCLQPGCSAQPTEIRHNVPSYMCSAMAISFHSYHEGHLFEMWLDGKKLHPSI